MKEKSYEILDHTADIAVRIHGKDLQDLFKNAGLAIFELSCRKQYTRDKTHTDLQINLKAGDLHELFVNWLNELLSLSAAENLIFHNIKINKIDEHNLDAVAIGSSIANYKVNTEIKAATYHQLKVEKADSGWIAEVIFDV